ncbi:MAG: single-strand DNA-binding protein [Oceanicoccus sp.]|jgi:single-strand DNA-binding protein
MYSLNRLQLLGNVTRDPEVRQTSGGQTVATFSIATNRVWTDKAGQKQEKADFHNVVVWGKLAEICQQYVKKGRKIYVEGRMQTRDWEGEDGVKRYRSEVVAENVILLNGAGAPTGEGAGANRETNAAAVKPSATPAASPSAVVGPKKEEEMSLDDLPF